MACSVCPRDKVAEAIPEKWEDLKDNPEHFGVFLQMLGTAERAMVNYLEWYDGCGMASGKQLDKDTLVSRFIQVSRELALVFGEDVNEDWTDFHKRLSSQFTKEAFWTAISTLRDEFRQNLIAWWADNASLVMARIWAMETTEATPSHTHVAAANDDDTTSILHDWKTQCARLLAPHAPVQAAAGKVVDPIDHNQHLSSDDQTRRQEIRQLLNEEREKDRQEMQELFRQDVQAHLRKGQEQCRQEMHKMQEGRKKDRQGLQELLQQEMEQIKLVCDKAIQDEREEREQD
ncbi:hypothetical protein DFS34DRAFT_625062 [Phlyctochytrium arcticum]|nr:hypothetical protein DFS34DRAFT_625062 [Phlyctochytrium arcticum]